LTLLLDDIPEGLFQQMTSCQAATNEFLRQFWTSTHPPPIDEAMLHVPTQAQRTAKIAKMVVYLSNTHEKVESLVQIASKYSTDGAKVRTVSSNPLHDFERLFLRFSLGITAYAQRR
jgi:transcription initiation factor TFIIH subunit 1